MSVHMVILRPHENRLGQRPVMGRDPRPGSIRDLGTRSPSRHFRDRASIALEAPGRVVQHLIATGPLRAIGRHDANAGPKLIGQAGVAAGADGRLGAGIGGGQKPKRHAQDPSPRNGHRSNALSGAKPVHSTRRFPDNLQVRGNRTPVPSSREQNFLRSHPAFSRLHHKTRKAPAPSRAVVHSKSRLIQPRRRKASPSHL